MRPQRHPLCWFLALSWGLAAGCFQPFDAYEAQAEEAPELGGGAPNGADAAPFAADANVAQPAPVAPAPPWDAGVGAPTPAHPPLAPPLLPTPSPLFDAGTPDPCQDLPPDQCALIPGCSTATLYAFDPARNCSTSERRIVCSRGLCGLFGTTLASDPSGQAFFVPAACVPRGYTPLPRRSGAADSPCPTMSALAACPRHRDERACTADPNYHCTSVSALSYDPVERCVGGRSTQRQFLGCTAWSSAPPDPSSYFRDPQGTIWRVPAKEHAEEPREPDDWTPIAPSSVIPDAGAELPTCFVPLS